MSGKLQRLRISTQLASAQLSPAVDGLQSFVKKCGNLERAVAFCCRAAHTVDVWTTATDAVRRSRRTMNACKERGRVLAEAFGAAYDELRRMGAASCGRAAGRHARYHRARALKARPSSRLRSRAMAMPRRRSRLSRRRRLPACRRPCCEIRVGGLFRPASEPGPKGPGLRK